MFRFHPGDDIAEKEEATAVRKVSLLDYSSFDKDPTLEGTRNQEIRREELLT